MKRNQFSLVSFYSKLDWVFPVYFGVYFIEFFFGLWGITAAVKFLCICLTFIYIAKIINSTDNGLGSRGIFTLFYAYYILSGLLYSINGVPFNCYLNEVFNSIPAMFFFYVGLAEKRTGNQFYNKMMKSCTVCMLIGLLLYITTPGWYVSRRIQIAEMTSWSGTSYDADSLLSNMRFSSFLFDSYEVSTYGMIALAIALFVFFVKSNKEKKWIDAFFIIINYVAAVLSQQRVAMIPATISVLFYIFYGIKRGRGKQSRAMLITLISLVVVAVAFVLFYLGERAEQLQSLLTDRWMNMDFSSALEERNYQNKIFESWTMPITGMGTGSGGSKAGIYGLPHVNDAGFYLLLYENGILGVMLFTLLIGSTLFRCVKHMRVYLTELVIILFILVAMIGSNILNLGYMLIMPFWYTIGRVWNKNHYKDALLNKDYI